MTCAAYTLALKQANRAQMGKQRLTG